MHKLVLGLSLFYPLAVFSNVCSSDVVEGLKLLDNASISKQGEIECSESGNDSYGNDRHALKCAIDMCGPAKELDTVYLTNEKIDKLVDESDFQKDLDKYGVSIDSAADQTIESFKKFKASFQAFTNEDNLKKHFAELDHEKWNDLANDIFKLYRVGDFVMELEGGDRNTPYDYDYEDVPVKLQDDLRAVFEERKLKLFRSPFYLEAIAGTDEFDKVIKDVEKDLSGKYSEMIKKNPSLKKELPSLNSLKYKFLKPSEKLEVLGEIYSAYEENYPETYCEKKCREYIVKLAKNSAVAMDGYLNEMSKGIEDKKNDFKLSCKSFIYTNSEMKTNYEKLRKDMPGIFEQIYSEFTPYLSKDSMEKIKGEFNKLNIVNDPNFWTGKKPDVDAEISSIPREIKESFDIDWDFKEVWRHKKWLSEKSKSNLSPFSFLGACRPAELWDTANTVKDKKVINLSHFTCKNHSHGEFGRTLIIHELGHILDMHMARKGELSGHSSKALESMKSCLTEQQVAITKMLGNNAINSYKTSEDFADYFAFLVTSKEKNSRPHFCTVLRKDSSKNHYRDVSFSINIADPHSNDLFRILHEAHVRKMKMPETCQKLLSQNEDLYKLKDCRK